MLSKYERMDDGQVYQINIDEGCLRYACCDCGMVHEITFCLEGDMLMFKYEQIPRATAQLRRHKFGNLHNCVGRWSMTDKKKGKMSANHAGKRHKK